LDNEDWPVIATNYRTDQNSIATRTTIPGKQYGADNTDVGKGRRLQHDDGGRRTPGARTSRGLRGIREEKSCTLYVKNINVDEEERDEDIGHIVKDYAKQRNIRVMSTKVIRNKYVQDVVGCKLVIPQSQEHFVLAAEFWPHGITCRRWEANNKWYEGRNNNIWSNSHGNDKADGGYSHDKDSNEQYQGYQENNYYW